MKLLSIAALVKNEYRRVGNDPECPEVTVAEYFTTSTEHDEFSITVYDADGVIDKFNLRISKVPFATARTLI